MKRLLFTAGSACALAAAMIGPVSAHSGRTLAPTFNKDVAPILFANCVTCHRPGEIAPMSLLSYKEARPWARSIKKKVLTREMPPWFADPKFGTFRNKRSLTLDQIDTLVAWVDAGAPEGAGPTPVAPEVEGYGTAGFMNRPPDYIIEQPVEFEIPAAATVIPVFSLWAKAPFTEDKYLEAVELQPSNRRVAHHSAVYVGHLPAGVHGIGTGPAWRSGPIVDAVPIAEDGTPVYPSDNSEFGNHLVSYVPGGGFQRYPAGLVKRIGRDDYLQWAYHYTVSGKHEKDRHTLRLWFSTAPATYEVRTSTVSDVEFADGKELVQTSSGPVRRPDIPSFAGNWAFLSLRVIRTATTLHSLSPHMHFRGKDMKYSVTYPDGREETILNVPRYSFNWQMPYELEEPLRLPAGSVLRVTAHYDNSQRNLDNPAPDKDVIWGSQSWEEMYMPFIEISVDKEPLRSRLFDF